MQGLTQMYVIVFSHYIILFIIYCNYDVSWLIWFIFSFMWIWVVSFLQDSSEKSVYYKNVTSGLWNNPLFWLIVLFGVVVAVMPIYFWLKWR